jgi:hypothetical protein
VPRTRTTYRLTSDVAVDPRFIRKRAQLPASVTAVHIHNKQLLVGCANGIVYFFSGGETERQMHTLSAGVAQICVAKNMLWLTHLDNRISAWNISTTEKVKEFDLKKQITGMCSVQETVWVLCGADTLLHVFGYKGSLKKKINTDVYLTNPVYVESCHKVCFHVDCWLCAVCAVLYALCAVRCMLCGVRSLLADCLVLQVIVATPDNVQMWDASKLKFEREGWGKAAKASKQL